MNNKKKINTVQYKDPIIKSDINDKNIDIHSDINGTYIKNSKFRNKTAVALSYHPEEPAPRIIASGKGYLADKIIRKASEYNIPLHKDDQLAQTLSRLEIGDFIPPELYEVVAEILIFVDNMDQIKKKVLPNEY